jgi:hypothetical protein
MNLRRHAPGPINRRAPSRVDRARSLSTSRSQSTELATTVPNS